MKKRSLIDKLFFVIPFSMVFVGFNWTWLYGHVNPKTEAMLRQERIEKAYNEIMEDQTSGLRRMEALGGNDFTVDKTCHRKIVAQLREQKATISISMDVVGEKLNKCYELTNNFESTKF